MCCRAGRHCRLLHEEGSPGEALTAPLIPALAKCCLCWGEGNVPQGNPAYPSSTPHAWPSPSPPLPHLESSLPRLPAREKYRTLPSAGTYFKVLKIRPEFT